MYVCVKGRTLSTSSSSNTESLDPYPAISELGKAFQIQGIDEGDVSPCV